MSNSDTVPFLDLKTMHAPLLAEIREQLGRVIDDHAFALGPAVEKFEQEYARFCGVRHCVGLNSGTSAVHVALLCAGVQPGDEVITTPATWVSTAWAVSYIGATPVFVDIDPHTHCLNPDAVEQAITPRTTALLPVHLYGHPADMDPLLDIARRHNLAVVEDAAQAHGARYKGRRCGSLADIAAFSFYPGKNLGALGEAGAVLTDNDEWAARARALRDHAQQGRHHHVEVGYNYRMDGIQAAALLVKLPHLDTWNEQRRGRARQYNSLLADVCDLECPAATVWAEPVWHIYAVQHPQRDELRAHLNDQGVQCGVHYPTAVHRQPAYHHLGYAEGALPNAEQLARRQLSLPLFPTMTNPQIQAVETALHSFEKRHRRSTANAGSANPSAVLH